MDKVISIVGFGPRGVETLAALIDQFRNTEEQLQINVFDKYFPSGRVWNDKQASELVMNTVVQQISYDLDNPLKNNMYSWAKAEASDFISTGSYSNKTELINMIQNLSLNSYAPRKLMGIYQDWFIQQLIDNLPNNIRVRSYEDNVSEIKSDEMIVKTNSGDFKSDKIILAIGHTEPVPSDKEISFGKMLADNKIKYWPIQFPAEIDLTEIKAQDTILMRGLGLTFFDYVSMLSEGRGGKFVYNDELELVYQKSGLEPKIYGYSRRDVPLMPKPINQKSPADMVKPKFLTDRFIEDLPIGTFNFENFWQIFSREIMYVYYMLLAKQSYPMVKLIDLKTDLLNLDETISEIVNKYSFKNDDLLDLDGLINPAEKYFEGGEYTKFIEAYLSKIWNQVKEGNLQNPLAAALDVFRDLRPQVRKLIEQQKFAPDNDISTDNNLIEFFERFEPIDSFLSAGPPAFRYEQLIALIKAGVVKFLPYKAKLSFEKQSVQVELNGKNEMLPVDGFVEARLPVNNISRVDNGIFPELLNDHTIKLQIIGGAKNVVTGAAMNSRKTSATTNQNIFIFGVPTNRFHWYTTVIPQIFPNDQSKEIAKIIAKNS